MQYLVTGGAGFIGSHITETLLRDGHRVIVVDNLTTGQVSNLPSHPRLTFIQTNILDCHPDTFPGPIDGVVHLAATASVNESWHHPLATHHNNLSAMIAVLVLCQQLSIPRIVFASSAAVYGNTIRLPVVETHPTHPISPYGLQKLACEQYASLFAQQFGLTFVGLRLFNVFGPRQSPTSPYSGVISIFTSAMQQGLPITLYGDGSQTRDFVYVQDVAKAFSQALTREMEPGSSLICNIGTGKGISLNQLIDVLKKQFPQWTLDPQHFPARPGDIQHSRADIAQAIAQLDFTPEWSIQSGLQHLIAESMPKVA